jgi:propionyl-CoA synthetase
MRQIADGETPKVPATIDDPAILDEIKEALGVVAPPSDPAAATP